MSVNLISKSAYARHRGVDEKAVRKAVAEGRISLINGKIDPAVADIQWAANTRARVGSGGAEAPAPGADLLTQATAVQANASTQPPTSSNSVASGYAAARAWEAELDAKTKDVEFKKLIGEVLFTDRVSAGGFEVGRELRDAMESSVNSLAAELASVASADECANILRQHNRAMQLLLSKSFREKIAKRVADASTSATGIA